MYTYNQSTSSTLSATLTPHNPFPNVKLRILSSKISHTAALAAHLFTPPSSGTPPLLADIFGDAGVGADTETAEAVGRGAAAAAVGGSTSTTLNTALPSNTRCTLS
jgi:hypothetical protein